MKNISNRKCIFFSCQIKHFFVQNSLCKSAQEKCSNWFRRFTLNLHEKSQIERKRKIFVVEKVFCRNYHIWTLPWWSDWHWAKHENSPIEFFYLCIFLFSINAQNIHTYCRHMQNIPKKNVLISHSVRYFFEENHNSPKTSNSFMDCQLECLVS